MFIVTEVIVNENNRAKPRTSKLYLQILKYVYTVKKGIKKNILFLNSELKVTPSISTVLYNEKLLQVKSHPINSKGEHNLLYMVFICHIWHNLSG